MKLLRYLFATLAIVFCITTFSTAIFGVENLVNVFGDLTLQLVLGTSSLGMAAAPVIPFIDNNGNVLYSESGVIGTQARTGGIEERSKIAETDIVMGHPVQLGTEGGQVKILDVDATRLFGIAKYNPQAQGFTEGTKYKAEEAALIFTKGVIWVWAEEAVNEKDTVRVRLVNHASDGNKLVGYFGKTADEDKTAVLKGAYFESVQETATGGPVMVKLTDSTELILDNLV